MARTPRPTKTKTAPRRPAPKRASAPKPTPKPARTPPPFIVDADDDAHDHASGPESVEAKRAARLSAPSPELTSGQRRNLRSLAHHLNPIVMVGKNGITDALIITIDEALLAHELIKVKVLEAAQTDPDELAPLLCDRVRAACPQTIGRLIVLYRPHPETPTIHLHKPKVIK